jgi:hypothetical protein
MAIVFISPQKRQRTLIFSIAGFFALVLLAIGLSVFLAKPQVAPAQQYFTATPININWKVLKSDQFTKLVPVPEVEKEFQFSAKAADGSAKTGIVSAVSEDDANKALQNLSLASIVLTELKPGRDNPFSPYYQATK